MWNDCEGKARACKSRIVDAIFVLNNACGSRNKHADNVMTICIYISVVPAVFPYKRIGNVKRP